MHNLAGFRRNVWAAHGYMESLASLCGTDLEKKYFGVVATCQRALFANTDAFASEREEGRVRVAAPS